MFASNQEFAITGDSKEALKEVLECALSLDGTSPEGSSGLTNIKSFRDDEKGLSFGKFKASDTGETEIPFKMTLTALVEQIYVYLDSAETTKRYSVLRDSAYEGDGTLQNGWRVYHSGNWAYIFTVEPFLTYYAV